MSEKNGSDFSQEKKKKETGRRGSKSYVDTSNRIQERSYFVFFILLCFFFIIITVCQMFYLDYGKSRESLRATSGTQFWSRRLYMYM